MSAPEDGLSVVALGTALLRRRWLVVRWMLAVGLLAMLTVAFKKPSYRASAAFISQGQQSSSSSLAGLAGQFGVSLPSGASTQSPEFYAQLLKSRAVLLPIVHDTFAVEKGGGRGPLVDVLEIEASTPLQREEQAIRALQLMVDVTVTKAIGVVSFTVTSPSRGLSLQIAERLIDGINRYNEETRQSVAASERRVLEKSLGTARQEMIAAEEALEQYTAANRVIGLSASSSRDRLQRAVDLKASVYTSLAQALEDARIREVRDTPAIALFEAPWVPTYPMPRGRVLRTLLGMMAGAVLAIVIVFFQTLVEIRRRAGDPEFNALLNTVDDLKRNATRPFRRSAPAAS